MLKAPPKRMTPNPIVNVNCIKCQIEMGRFGFVQNKTERIQRWRCRSCKTTTTEDRTLGDLRIDPAIIKSIVHLLCEGVGIRACERLTGAHRDTVMNVLEFAGKRSVELFNKHILNLSVREVQVDELYSFVYKKEKNCFPGEFDVGEHYTYLALDPISKLILGYHVGKRDQHNTDIFISDLGMRVDKNKHFDITSDGFPAYTAPIAEEFYGRGAYAQLIKNFHLLREAKQYGILIKCTEKTVIFGDRQNQSISTSHVERLNLSVRLFNRRFTRKTIGYSKKLENLKHSVSLFVAYYNFCWIHSTIKMTPAMAAGLTLKRFTVDELLNI